MKVKLKLLGCWNKPVDGISRWFYLYFAEAANGVVEQIMDEDYVEDGVYELPDKDWTYNDTEEYGEDLITEQE